MNLGLRRGAQPVAACPRCVYRLHERHLRAGRCPNCDLPLRGAPPSASLELSCLAAGTTTGIEPAAEGDGCDVCDVFDVLELDPDDTGAQAWLIRARKERDRDRARIAGLLEQAMVLEQEVQELRVERGQLIALVNGLLRRS